MLTINHIIGDTGIISSNLVSKFSLGSKDLKVAQMVKHLPAMQETPAQFLGREDLLEKGQGTHSSNVGFPCGSYGKEYVCNAGDLGSIPELGRCPGAGNSYPLQYSALYSPQGAKSQTRLSNFHFHLSETQFSHLYNGCGKTPSLTAAL